MELLRQQLIAYRPWNEQEERDREELLRRLHKIGVSGFTGRIDAVTWLKFRKEINALLA